MMGGFYITILQYIILIIIMDDCYAFINIPSSVKSSTSTLLQVAMDNDNITQKLSVMKVSELKDLYKRFGGKPGNMRKADLVTSLCEIMLEKMKNKQQQEQLELQLQSTQDSPSIPSYLENIPESINKPLETETKSSRRIRNLHPLNNNNDNLDEEYNRSKYVPAWKKFEYPHGPFRNTRLDPVGGADMDLSFLGTASCIPSLTRGVSCIGFRYQGDMWLFDAGESSQIQVQRSKVKFSKIKKIFISHAHGDHSFGLPGMLCLMGQSTQDERGKAVDSGDTLAPVDIYGPEGTRDLVRSMVQLTYSRVVAPFRVHELKDVPYLHLPRHQPPTPVVKTRFDSRFGEVAGSRDIYPDENGHYLLFEEGDMKVHAAPMQHTVPCVGYVISEREKPGRLRFERCKDVVDRNREALKTEAGMKDPNKVLKILKELGPDESFDFPDGTRLSASDVLEPPRKGRKIVIMGDTCSGDFIEPLASEADVLVHEATNAWMREFDRDKYSNYISLERDAIRHGHSTPQMAGKFAQRINAKRLVLTHFSPRYRGDDSENSMKTMWRIEEMAREKCNMWNKNDVIAAWDQMELSVPSSTDVEHSAIVQEAVKEEEINSKQEMLG